MVETGQFFGQSSIPSFAQALERMLNPYQTVTMRVPFYMTSSYRMSREIPGISMRINPQSVSFRAPKRITRAQTQAGSMFIHWTDATGRNNDVMELEFRGNTGNINLNTGYRKGGWEQTAASYIQKGSDWVNSQLSDASQAKDTALGVEPVGVAKNLSGPLKLVKFWDLYSLTREPVVDPDTGAPVYYYIKYSSTMFGGAFVTFVGHFSKVMDFEDSADSPFSKNYTFSFTAISSQPSMNAIYSHVVNSLSQELLNNLQEA